MTSHRAQRLAEHFIRRACRRLPGDARHDRYREWTAEAHAILTDPGTRSQARRTACALLYAADHARGTRHLPDRATTTPSPRDRSMRQRSRRFTLASAGVLGAWPISLAADIWYLKSFTAQLLMGLVLMGLAITLPLATLILWLGRRYILKGSRP